MFSLFPPPPKPPKRNYIQENIKHLQSLQVHHHKQDGGNTATIKKKLNPLSRPVPKLKPEGEETKLTNYVSTTKIATQGTTRPAKQNATSSINVAKKNTKFNFRTNLKLPSISSNAISNYHKGYSTVKSPKRRDASCQYLESDSRYYFADGSTVHFVYPSENRKSIFVKPLTSVRKVERKNSVYLQTTESYRRKRNTTSEVISNNYKDACCQYNESDCNAYKELPEENLGPPKSIAESNDLEQIDIPKLNLKDSLTDLLQGDGSMASIIEAGRFGKAQDSKSSTAESSVSIPIFKDDKINLTDASVVPLVDLHQECAEMKNTEKPLTNEELMKKLKIQFSKRVDELNHMPMRSDTLRARTRKIQLEKELMELEKNIKHLSYPKARVDLRAIS